MGHSARARPLIMFFVLWLANSTSLLAQWMGRQTACYADSIRANPNRPTVADPADITQYGVLELETGWDRSWPLPDEVQSSFGGLLKFGILCDVELRWNSTFLLSQSAATGVQRGFGDNWLGPQVRIYRQTSRVPTLAVSYAYKLPSASFQKGLGTGQVDHALTFLASKDLMSFHFDFNVTHFLIGNSGPTGFVSSLWALTYQVTPRLVVDGGFEGGLSSGGPHWRVFAGVTYAIANLYPGWRQNRHARARF